MFKTQQLGTPDQPPKWLILVENPLSPEPRIHPIDIHSFYESAASVHGTGPANPSSDLPSTQRPDLVISDFKPVGIRKDEIEGDDNEIFQICFTYRIKNIGKSPVNFWKNSPEPALEPPRCDIGLWLYDTEAEKHSRFKVEVVLLSLPSNILDVGESSAEGMACMDLPDDAKPEFKNLILGLDPGWVLESSYTNNSIRITREDFNYLPPEDFTTHDF